jgi:hypothetical protein
MHTQKLKKLIRAGLYAAIIGCAAGAATGTYAWYSYQKDVDVDFVGTTIKADKEIQVGLRSSSRISALDSAYQLGEIDCEENVSFGPGGSTFVIYWVRGNYLTEILKTFQNAIGSGQGTLNAITAGHYKAGWAEDIGNDTDSLAANTWNGFKNTPTTKSEDWKYQDLVNNMKNYFYLPLAFRAISNERGSNGAPIYLDNTEIFLGSFVTEDLDYKATNEVDLAHAVRCKVDYPAEQNTAKNFIFDPNAADDYDLPVAGALNLNLDRYYDSYTRYPERKRYEIPYGQWENNTVAYADDPIATDGILHGNACTTFRANHEKGVYPIDMTQSVPCTCETKAKSYAVDPSFTAGKGIVKTDAYKNYGYVDLSIYLEGWDTNIDNDSDGSLDSTKSTVGHTFSINLEFSIS